MEKDKKAKRSLANVQAYKNVFLGSDDGRKVLWDMMKNNSIIDMSHVPGDPYSTAFNEGCRATVLHIIKKINIDVSKLEKMIQEGFEEEDRIGEGL